SAYEKGRDALPKTRSGELMRRLLRSYFPKIDRQDFEAIVRERPNSMEPGCLALIAFFLAAGGYALHRLSRGPAPTPPRPAPGPPSGTDSQDGASLVLVINAARTEMLGRLQTAGRVPPESGEELYRATQALWMGGENEFASSQLPRWFSKDKITAEPS